MIRALHLPRFNLLKVAQKFGLLVAIVHGYLTVVNSYPELLVSYPLMTLTWMYVAYVTKQVELLLLNIIFTLLWLYGLYDYFYVI